MTYNNSSDLKVRTFLLYGAPVILYACCILALSSIPDFSAPELPIVPFDKVAHLLEYGGFASIIVRSAGHYARKSSLWLQYSGSLAVVAIFAIVDELYQSTVPGRSSDPADLLADILGGALAIGSVILWRRRR